MYLQHMEARRSWRGSVANESNHCIIGKQIKSCELLLLDIQLRGLNSGQHSVWGHFELGSASLITDYTSLSDLKQCSSNAPHGISASCIASLSWWDQIPRSVNCPWFYSGVHYDKIFLYWTATVSVPAAHRRCEKKKASAVFSRAWNPSHVSVDEAFRIVSSTERSVSKPSGERDSEEAHVFVCLRSR